MTQLLHLHLRCIKKADGVYSVMRGEELWKEKKVLKEERKGKLNPLGAAQTE